MTTKFESAPNDYPLPVVGPAAVAAVLESVLVDNNPTSEVVEYNLEPAFDLVQAWNSVMAEEIGELLASSGYTAPECVRAAKASVAATHLLLLAQARIDQGLPPVDLQAQVYLLPTVIEDNISQHLAGAHERLAAKGMSSYEELVAENEWIPRALSALGIDIGRGHGASPAMQAAEIAAITTHSMLREQAAIDAMHNIWGDSPLG